MDLTKAEAIRNSIRETRERRKYQKCKVYQLKFQNLKKSDIERLERLFAEAKWLYNYIIADIENRLTSDAWKLKKVTIKTPSGSEERKLEIISSQIRQGIVDRIKNNLKALKAAKDAGYKVGKLRFKSTIRSLPLKQFNVTYKIDRNRNRIKIQGIKKWFRVLGLHQIPENADIANAHLVKKPSGYYLYVTCYVPKESDKVRQPIEKPIGIDFGIKNQLTLTNGIVISWSVTETERLKRLQRQLARKKKGSNNYRKCRKKLQKEYECVTNIRKDIQNRIYGLLKHYKVVVIQDENIKGWHSGLFGKQIQSTGIGGITSRLKHSLETLILVDRYKKTTGICCNCGTKKDLTLADRTFVCDRCGLRIDRDLNSAITILKIGLKEEITSLKNLPLGWWEVTPVERDVTVRVLGPSSYIRANSLAEAGSPLF